MSERATLLRDAFSALGRGDASAFRSLFAKDARWLGIEGTGPDGTTPT